MSVETDSEFTGPFTETAERESGSLSFADLLEGVTLEDLAEPTSESLVSDWIGNSPSEVAVDPCPGEKYSAP